MTNLHKNFTQIEQAFPPSTIHDSQFTLGLAPLRGVHSRFATFLISWLLTAQVFADELADKGRAVFKQYQHTVVTVSIVLKSKISVGGMGGQSNEARQEVTGTVLDSSGLIVLALSATDPGQLMQTFLAGAEGGDGAEGDTKFKMETELSDVKVLLDDGTEVPAEVVLRDKDLDLAYIKPKNKLAAPMEALDFSKAGRVEILDQIVALNRLGNAAGRAYAASLDRISAVVERPRLFYVPAGGVASATLGSPAFSLDGKPLGIFVMRTMKSRGGGLGMFSFQPDSLTAVIVPAQDILKGAKQVPAAVAEEKKEKSQKE